MHWNVIGWALAVDTLCGTCNELLLREWSRTTRRAKSHHIPQEVSNLECAVGHCLKPYEAPSSRRFAGRAWQERRDAWRHGAGVASDRGGSHRLARRAAAVQHHTDDGEAHQQLIARQHQGKRDHENG